MTPRDLLARAHPHVCTLLCKQSHQTEHALLCREIGEALKGQPDVEGSLIAKSHDAIDAAGVPQGGALTTRIGLLVQQVHSLQTECGHREADCRELEQRLAAAEQREQALRSFMEGFSKQWTAAHGTRLHEFENVLSATQPEGGSDATN